MVPSFRVISEVADKYQKLSYGTCAVFETGEWDLLGIWNRWVTPHKAAPIVKLLMKHYDVPVCEPPTANSKQIINLFWQAKYGLVAGFHAAGARGKFDINEKFVKLYCETSEE